MRKPKSGERFPAWRPLLSTKASTEKQDRLLDDEGQHSPEALARDDVHPNEPGSEGWSPVDDAMSNPDSQWATANRQAGGGYRKEDGRKAEGGRTVLDPEARMSSSNLDRAFRTGTIHVPANTTAARLPASPYDTVEPWLVKPEEIPKLPAIYTGTLNRKRSHSFNQFSAISRAEGLFKRAPYDPARTAPLDSLDLKTPVPLPGVRNLRIDPYGPVRATTKEEQLLQLTIPFRETARALRQKREVDASTAIDAIQGLVNDLRQSYLPQTRSSMPGTAEHEAWAHRSVQSRRSLNPNLHAGWYGPLRTSLTPLGWSVGSPNNPNPSGYLVDSKLVSGWGRGGNAGILSDEEKAALIDSSPRQRGMRWITSRGEAESAATQAHVRVPAKAGHVKTYRPLVLLPPGRTQDYGDELSPYNAYNQDFNVDRMPDEYYSGTGEPTPFVARVIDADTGEIEMVNTRVSFDHFGGSSWNHNQTFNQMETLYRSHLADEVRNTPSTRLVFNVYNEQDVALLAKLLTDDDWVRANKADIHVLMPIRARHEQVLKHTQRYIAGRLASSSGEALELIHKKEGSRGVVQPYDRELSLESRKSIQDQMRANFPDVNIHFQWTDSFKQSERFIQEFSRDRWFDAESGRAPSYPTRHSMVLQGYSQYETVGGMKVASGQALIRRELHENAEYASLSQVPVFTGTDITGYRFNTSVEIPDMDTFDASSAVLTSKGDPGQELHGFEMASDLGGGKAHTDGRRVLPYRSDYTEPLGHQEIRDVYISPPEGLKRGAGEDVFDRRTTGTAIDAAGNRVPLGEVIDVQGKLDDDRFYTKLLFGDPTTGVVGFEYEMVHPRYISPRRNPGHTKVIGNALDNSLNLVRRDPSYNGILPQELHANMPAVKQAHQTLVEMGRDRLQTGLSPQTVARLSASTAAGATKPVFGLSVSSLPIPTSALDVEDVDLLNDMNVLRSYFDDFSSPLNDAQRISLGNVVRGISRLTGRTLHMDSVDELVADMLWKKKRVLGVGAVLQVAHRSLRDSLTSAMGDGGYDPELDHRHRFTEESFYQRAFTWSNDQPIDVDDRASKATIKTVLGEVEDLHDDVYGFMVDQWDVVVRQALEDHEIRVIASLLSDQSRSGFIQHGEVQDAFQEILTTAWMQYADGADANTAGKKRLAITGLDLRISGLDPRSYNQTMGAMVHSSSFQDPGNVPDGGRDELDDAWVDDGLKASDHEVSDTPVGMAADVAGERVWDDSEDPLSYFTKHEGHSVGDLIAEAMHSAGVDQPTWKLETSWSEAFNPGGSDISFNFTEIYSGANPTYGLTYEYTENLIKDMSGSEDAILRQRSVYIGGQRWTIDILGRIGGSAVIEPDGTMKNVEYLADLYEMRARHALEAGVEAYAARRIEEVLEAHNVAWDPHYSDDDLQTMFNEGVLDDAIKRKARRQSQVAEFGIGEIRRAEDIRRIADRIVGGRQRSSAVYDMNAQAFPTVGLNSDVPAVARENYGNDLLSAAEDIRAFKTRYQTVVSGYYQQLSDELSVTNPAALDIIRAGHMGGDRSDLVWDRRETPGSHKKRIVRKFLNAGGSDMAYDTTEETFEALVRASVVSLEGSLNITEGMAQTMADDVAGRRVLKGILLNAVIQTDADILDTHGGVSVIEQALDNEGTNILTRAHESETAENVHLSTHVGQMEVLEQLAEIQDLPEVHQTAANLNLEATVTRAQGLDTGAGTSGTLISFARRDVDDEIELLDRFGTLLKGLR